MKNIFTLAPKENPRVPPRELGINTRFLPQVPLFQYGPVSDSHGHFYALMVVFDSGAEGRFQADHAGV